jgi:hypothetical protein
MEGICSQLARVGKRRSLVERKTPPRKDLDGVEKRFEK